MGNELPIGCQDSLNLAQIIDQTAQIEDLLSIEGMEQELRDLANLPVPSYIPPLAEVVDSFNHQLAAIPDKLSESEAEHLSDVSERIREETNKFLLSAVTRCIVSHYGKGV